MSSPAKLGKAEIVRCLELLNEELAAAQVEGELYMVGGAVMCVAFDARPATRDVDGYFAPARQVREAAVRVAGRLGIPTDWLNDAVKGFLGGRGEYDTWREWPNLRVFVARPAYLLALKCAALRIGEGFQDLDDIRYLLRYLNITTFDEAWATVTRYLDDAQLPVKARLALGEMLGVDDDDRRTDDRRTDGQSDRRTD